MSVCDQFHRNDSDVSECDFKKTQVILLLTHIYVMISHAALSDVLLLLGGLI